MGSQLMILHLLRNTGRNACGTTGPLASCGGRANMRPFWKMKNIVLALLWAVACFAQKRAITHEDIWLMKRTGEPVVSPDGRSVAVSVIEPDYDATKQSSDLWLVAADGHQAP